MSSFFRNMSAGSYGLPVRLRMIFTNIWRKRNGQGCCGNYGDPGC
jgi:hypothetical protein